MKRSNKKNKSKNIEFPEASSEPPSEEPAMSSEEIVAIPKTIFFKYPYLTLGSGKVKQVKSMEGIDTPSTPNTQMWKTNELYKMRTELINLSLHLDEIEQENNKVLTLKMQKLIDKMHDAERMQPLNFHRLDKGPSDKLDSSENINSRSISPTPNRSDDKVHEPKRKLREDKHSSTGRSRPSDESHLARQLKQDSIWDNSEFLMQPVQNVTVFNDALKYMKPYLIDQKIMNEPFGQHYSQRISRTDALIADPIKSKVILPSSPFEESKENVSGLHLHSRLISALIPVHLIEYNLPPEDRDEKESALMPDLRNGDLYLERLRLSTQTKQNNESITNKGTPTPQGLGFSDYGLLSFDARLQLELESLGINGKTNVLCDTNCPVMKCIQYEQMHQVVSVEKANEMINICKTLLTKLQPKFESRYRKHLLWECALKQYIEKRKNSSKKKKSHPHALEYE